MDIKECIEGGLLKKDSPSLEKARKSIKISEIKLEKAKKLINLKVLDMASVNLYSSMFHSSRALLFRDGFKEKSHYALYVYIREKYSDKIEPKFLNELNMLRLERHEIFYGFEEVESDEKDIQKLIVLIEEYIDVIRKLL
ncbi:MAG: HEPN domain-containing protein [Candidatus Woesearchaeota archaeon]